MDTEEIVEQRTIEELQEDVILTLKNIYDPEIPVNIYDLGLIYNIEISEDREVSVLMTLTAPNCPEAESIPVQVDFDLKRVPGVSGVKVLLTFDPPWDKDLLSEDAKMILGFF